MLDKRDVGQVFRDRLQTLAERHRGNQAEFARRIGVDRSAVTQLLSEESTRLPRAETLVRIAAAHDVSLDWLLGLSQSPSAGAEIGRTTEIERARGPDDQTQLERWHREAAGYKIRYVPESIPDQLLHPDLIADRFRVGRTDDIEAALETADESLAYARQPETDIEVCMPSQTFEMLARGEGVWRGLSPDVRRRQFERMATLLDELYPTFRLFLYDGQRTYAAPYTVFGPNRAAIYLGEMYVVVYTVEHIRALIRHFDDLIRRADTGPDRAAGEIARIGQEALG